MSEKSELEKVSAKIGELIREKALVQNRLTTASREYNPSSNSRENRRREIEISDYQIRIQAINTELKEKRLIKAALEKKEQKTSTDSFANLSSSDTNTHKPNESTIVSRANVMENPNIEEIPNTSSNTLTVQSNLLNIMSTASIPSSTSSATTSTPKMDSTSKSLGAIPKSTVNLQSPKGFEFPRNEESQESRAERIRAEQIYKDTWEKHVMNQARLEQQNLLLKESTLAKDSELTNPRDKFDVNSDINSFNFKDIQYQNNQMLQQPAQILQPGFIPSDRMLDNSWQENQQRFTNYKPTPQRLSNSQLHDLRQNQILFNQSYVEPNQSERRRVTFENIPTNIPQTNTIPQQTNNFNQNQNIHTQTARNTFLKRLKLIPTFSGDSHKELRDFLEISETLFYSCMNEAEEQEFYEQMVLQLRGEPLSLVKRIQNFRWETIKNTLLKQFGYLSNKEIIQSQLENLHQEKDESLSKFTERVRKLLVERNSIYTNLTEEQRAEHNRLARRAFAKGLKDNNLRRKMLNRGASSLEDAIAFALEAENDILHDVPRNETFCRVCQTVGHRENQCRRKDWNNSEMGRLFTALRSLNSRPNNNRNQYPDSRNNNRSWQNNNSNSNWPNNNSNSNWTQNQNWAPRNPNNGYNNNQNTSNQNPNWQNNPNRNFNNGNGNRPNPISNQNRPYQNNNNNGNRPRNNFVRPDLPRNNPFNTASCGNQHFETEPEN